MRAEWVEKARAAKKMLSGKNYGGREKALLDAGWGDANTARRAIFALNFLELAKRSYRSEYELLRHAPFSIVEKLGQWHAFDPTGALNAVHDWAKGKYSVRTLADAVKIARDQATNPTTKELSANKYRKAAANSVRAFVSDLVKNQVSIELSFKEGKDTPPIDYCLKWYEEGFGKFSFRRAGAIIVGPYTNASLYKKRRHEWILRAFALAWFFDKVLLVLPNSEFIEQYVSAIELYKTRAYALTEGERQPDVSFMVFEAENVTSPLTDDEVRAIQSTFG